ESPRDHGDGQREASSARSAARAPCGNRDHRARVHRRPCHAPPSVGNPGGGSYRIEGNRVVERKGATGTGLCAAARRTRAEGDNLPATWSGKPAPRNSHIFGAAEFAPLT